MADWTEGIDLFAKEKVKELEAQVEQLLDENANLKAENNHIKQSYTNLLSKVAQAQQILRIV